MAEGRDYSHEAYQAPFLERYGPMLGGGLLLVGLASWLLVAKPWEYRRPTSALKADPAIRLSKAESVVPVFSRQTSRVAIHGSAVYVTWVDTRTDPPSLLLATSTDSGKTFAERVVEAPEAGRQLLDPSLLTDSQGSLYCLYTYSKADTKRLSTTSIQGNQRTEGASLNSGTQVFSRLARSDDGGVTWPVIRDVASVYSPILSSPVMGIDSKGTIHLAALGLTGGQEQVVATRTVNRGDSFEPDVQVSMAPKGRRRDLAIAVSPAGRVAVLWSDLRNATDLPENGEIFGALANAGKDFSSEVQLIKPALKPPRQRYPSVSLTDAGELSVIFEEGIEKERRDRTVLRYAHSRTFGAEFAPAQTLFAKQVDNPSAAQLVIGREGYLYLTCVGTLTDLGQPTALVAQSKNGGKSFSTLTPVTDRFAPTVQNPAIAVQGNTMVISFFDFNDPKGKPGTQEVYAVRLVDEDLRG